jgi:hypothetical protein
MLGNTTPDPHRERLDQARDTTTAVGVSAELLARNLLAAGMPGSGKAAR